MTTKYLLPCACGKNTPIETSQAGETFSCACGQELTAPTLRGIRLLAVADDSSLGARGRGGAVHAGAAGAWGAAQGILLLGSLLLLAGLALEGFLLVTIPSIDAEQVRREANSLPPGESWRRWTEMETKGLPGDYSQRTYAILNAMPMRTKIMISGGVALVLGAALVALGAYQHQYSNAAAKPS